MELNADFTQRVVLRTSDIPWKSSPMPGVERRMLDRIGDEVARATSIVRYSPGSKFLAHTHGGGEEFIVLDGVFQDEHGDYPAGTYVRNPPTTSHTPRSDEGCTIFVKLWQFDPSDRTQFSTAMRSPPSAACEDINAQLLHNDARETVRFITLAPDAALYETPQGGAEILMMSGTAAESGDALGKGDWLRMPQGAPLQITATEQGASFWIKTGHLPFAQAPNVP